MDVDRTDIRMIEQLLRDGRASLRTLADELRLSPSTVSNRFHALEENDIIKGFKPVLDYEKLGFGLTAIVDVKADPAKMEAVAAAMRDHPEIYSFYEVTGEMDMVLVCKVTDRDALNRFVKTVQKQDGIVETKTNVVLTSPSESASPDLSALK